MKRVVLLMLVLGGCAMQREAGKPAGPPMTSAAEDQPLVQTYVQQQQSYLDELEHPAASGHKPECTRVCELVENICSLSGRICTVSARHEDDDSMKSACQDALDRCTRARADASGASCSCGD